MLWNLRQSAGLCNTESTQCIYSRLNILFGDRDNKTIEVCGTNIRKTYHGSDRLTKIQRLAQIYDVLKSKGVPNVDHLASWHVGKGGDPTAYLEPKGVSTLPKSLEQVFDAIGCILEALVVSPLFADEISR